MKQDDFVEHGWDPTYMCALSLSGQPSMQHPGKSRWELLASEAEEITIGDINFDETGVSGDACAYNALDCGTAYVFRAFAHAGRGYGRSDWAGMLGDVVCTTADCPPEECTHTQGFWKTHGAGDCHNGNNADLWPVTSLTLGTVSYDAGQLCSILNNPASGNGLVILAHQLISAKFNLAIGATCPLAQQYIAEADNLIGSTIVPGKDCPKPKRNETPAPCWNEWQTSTTSFLTGVLTKFNEGGLTGCPAHCDDGYPHFTPPGGEPGYLPTENVTWGKIKATYK